MHLALTLDIKDQIFSCMRHNHYPLNWIMCHEELELSSLATDNRAVLREWIEIGPSCHLKWTIAISCGSEATWSTNQLLHGERKWNNILYHLISCHNFSLMSSQALACSFIAYTLQLVENAFHSASICLWILSGFLVWCSNCKNLRKADEFQAKYVQWLRRTAYWKPLSSNILLFCSMCRASGERLSVWALLDQMPEANCSRHDCTWSGYLNVPVLSMVFKFLEWVSHQRKNFSVPGTKILCGAVRKLPWLLSINKRERVALSIRTFRGFLSLAAVKKSNTADKYTCVLFNFALPLGRPIQSLPLSSEKTVLVASTSWNWPSLLHHPWNGPYRSAGKMSSNPQRWVISRITFTCFAYETFAIFARKVWFSLSWNLSSSFVREPPWLAETKGLALTLHASHAKQCSHEWQGILSDPGLLKVLFHASFPGEPVHTLLSHGAYSDRNASLQLSHIRQPTGRFIRSSTSNAFCSLYPLRFTAIELVTLMELPASTARCWEWELLLFNELLLR